MEPHSHSRKRRALKNAVGLLPGDKLKALWRREKKNLITSSGDSDLAFQKGDCFTFLGACGPKVRIAVIKQLYSEDHKQEWIRVIHDTSGHCGLIPIHYVTKLSSSSFVSTVP
jgi:hypothetical protein